MEWPSRKAPGKAIRQINELRWLEADLAKVMELIKTHNVRLVLQGHHHFWEDILVLGRTRFIIGGAIAGRPSWRGTENGPRSFIQFMIQDGDISYRTIEYENN